MGTNHWAFQNETLKWQILRYCSLDILVNHLCRLEIELNPGPCPGGTPDVTRTDVEEVPFMTTVCVPPI
jgi:hypothetical protein